MGRDALTSDLAKRLPADAAVLDFINDVGASADNKNPHSLNQTRPLSNALSSKWVLELLAQYHLITWSFTDVASIINFSGKKAAKYVAGGWLEEYVSLVLASCTPHAHATDVNVLHENRGNVPNQFDGLALHRNRMLFIEAKTAIMHARPELPERVRAQR